jgi:hypothetical protein
MEDFLKTFTSDWSRKTHGNRVFDFDAFISHAGGDRSAMLARYLRSQGASVWHDESQEMGDAAWRMRLVNALLHSRYVVLVIDDDLDIANRDWVTAEWRSALEAEHLSGARRLIIANWTSESKVPAELSEHPQFNIDHQADELAQLVIAGNLLPSDLIEENAPPTITMVLESWPDNTIDEADRSPARVLLGLTQCALQEVQADLASPAPTLYQLSRLSFALHTADNLDLDSLGPVVTGLEALASFGHYEGRANSCFMLRALAVEGSKPAGDALLRVMRREESSQVLRLISEWFCAGTDGLPALAPQDYTRMLLVLPTVARELVDKVSSLAPREADVLRLRHAAFRVTNTVFEQLQPKSKRGELHHRFEYLLGKDAAPSEWEVFFRGLSSDARLNVPFVDIGESLQKPEMTIFLTFAERFANEYLPSANPVVWHMQYEVALLQPLAVASVFEQLGNKPLAVYRKLLNHLDAVARKDYNEAQGLVGDEIEPEDSRFLSLLCTELGCRLSVVEEFLKGPFREPTDEGLIHVRLLDTEGNGKLMGITYEIQRLQAFFNLGRFGEDAGPKHPVISVIWERWRGVPLV